MNANFRFWGSIDPRGRKKPAIVAEIPTAETIAGGAATLRLYDPIDSYGGDWGVSADEFAQALDALPSNTDRINLRINSPGGEVFQAVAILNLLRQHPASVTAYVDGIAASAASFIAAAADQVVVGQNSTMMIHDAFGLCMGNAADMQQMGALLDKLSNNVASIYQAKGGGTVADWRAAMLAETWYTAQEAVTAGLADRVDGPAEDAEAKAAFDLSIFKNAPAPKDERGRFEELLDKQEKTADALAKLVAAMASPKGEPTPRDFDLLVTDDKLHEALDKIADAVKHPTSGATARARALRLREKQTA